MKIDKKNNNAVTIDVTPVLPPTLTPVPLSTNVVIVLVPITAPIILDKLSALIILPKLWGLPFSSINLALLQQPTIVPIESNISIIENEITNIQQVNNEPAGKLKPSLNIDKNTGSPLEETKNSFKLFPKSQEIPETLPARIDKSATPRGIANNVDKSIPKITEPLTL